MHRLTDQRRGANVPAKGTTSLLQGASSLNKVVFYLVIALTTLLLGGCGNMMKATQVAKSQVVTFHQQFNAQNLNAIVAAADADMFQTTSKTDVIKLLAVVHKKLGKVTASQNERWNISSFNAVTTVELLQNTTFEQGKGTETFTFRIKGGKAYLAGYYINSQDLIMK